MTENGQASSGAIQKTTLLGKVSSGILDVAWRVLVIGLDKVGKTTFAAGAPGVLLAGPETGSAQVDVKRLPTITSFKMMRGVCRELLEDEHPYKTLAIDSLDWLEPLVWDECCRVAGKSDIEAFGYAKGYVLALDKWRLLISDFEKLWRNKSMNIVMTAHSIIRNFKNPEGPDFDRYEMALHPKAAGLMKQWVDVVGFAKYKTLVAEKEHGDAKAKGVGGRVRKLCTERTAAYDAGNRYNLPAELPLNWGDFEEAMKAQAPDKVSVLKEGIAELMDRLPKDKQKGAKDELRKAGSKASRLAQILDRMRALVDDSVEIQEPETEMEGSVKE